MANNDSTERGEPELVNVHVCIHRGRLLRREQVDSQQVISGRWLSARCLPFREQAAKKMTRAGLHNLGAKGWRYLAEIADLI